MGSTFALFLIGVAVALAVIVLLLVAMIRNKRFSLPIGLGIATIVLGVLLLMVPIPVVQENAINIWAILAFAWVCYFVWRAIQKSWSSPPTKSQMNRAIIDFHRLRPDTQVFAAIPALVYESPHSSARRWDRGMLIVSADGLFVHGPKADLSLHMAAPDVEAMSVVDARMDGIGQAPAVLITKRRGTEWLAVSETGQEGAELIAKWGEKAYGR